MYSSNTNTSSPNDNEEIIEIDDSYPNVVDDMIDNESNPLIEEEMIQFGDSNSNIENNEVSPQREGTTTLQYEEDSGVATELCQGMIFESWKSIDTYYRKYAKERGFTVRCRSTRKDLKGDPKDELKSSGYWVCSRFGKHEENKSGDADGKQKRTSSSIRVDCQARVSANYKPELMKWVIGLFHDEHNHIMVSPTSVKYIRHDKPLSSTVKSLVETFNEYGVPTGLPAYMIGHGGEDEISRRACWNHMRNVRLKDIDIGDAQAVLNYCMRKQAENPNFFYSIDCVNDRLVNFFWIDVRSRLSYEYFGDVFTFDTTYKTNKYSMPFAPFVRVNHHGQSILFGCALLQDEQESSFIWLFHTWLEAMHGKPPIEIITDQDHAMGNAIKKVFPNTRHRLCLWHIRNKFQERIPSNIYTKDFRLKLNECLHKSYSTEEFDKAWDELMDSNGLKNNELLNKLFEKREKWVPVYNRNTFFAGMQTTQRSESINAFFDSFVHKDTSLREFVFKYEKALERRISEESSEDYISKYKIRTLKHNLPIEEEAANFYTKNCFCLFQKTLTMAIGLIKKCVEKNGSIRKYEVGNPRIAWKKGCDVLIDIQTGLGSCGCHLFEFKGMLCSHMLAIYHFKNIPIPKEYLLHCWSKEANRTLKYPSNVKADAQDHYAFRVLHICHEMNHLSMVAGKSKEAYEFIVEKLHALKLEADKISEVVELNGEKGAMGENLVVPNDFDPANSEIMVILDPKSSQTKGRSMEGSNGRMKSRSEKALACKKKRCQSCGELGHYRTTCKKQKQDVTCGSSRLHDIEESEEGEEIALLDD